MPGCSKGLTAHVIRSPTNGAAPGGRFMPPRRITFDTVRELGLALPGVTESTSYGAPSLRVHGTMFACKAVHRSAEPNTLAVLLAFDDRDYLVSSNPRC